MFITGKYRTVPLHALMVFGYFPPDFISNLEVFKPDQLMWEIMNSVGALDTWTITNKQKYLNRFPSLKTPFPFYPLNQCERKDLKPRKIRSCRWRRKKVLPFANTLTLSGPWELLVLDSKCNLAQKCTSCHRRRLAFYWFEYIFSRIIYCQRMELNAPWLKTYIFKFPVCSTLGCWFECKRIVLRIVV